MIRINTQPVQSELPDKTPLLNMLRDELGLSGAKLGCGEGECGACMVLVDGRPQTSCTLPLWKGWDTRVNLTPCSKPSSRKTRGNADIA
jgi:aerobic-type carbon monoxide dehydrogenase small subunit (CoxS/CutS family)